MQLGMRVVTSREMAELDQSAQKHFGLDSLLLMEGAGQGTMEMLLKRYPRAGLDTEVLVFAGKGNNAGDAFVVARRLVCLGRRVRVFHLSDPKDFQGSAKTNFDILVRMKAKISRLERISELEAFFDASERPFTIIDGLLGTGLRGPLKDLYFEVVDLINARDFEQVVALDIPTGVSGDTGQVHGVAIRASLTVTYGFPKVGHFLPPGAGLRGELVCVDISLPPQFRREGKLQLLLPKPMAGLIQNRDRYGHKNSFGHALMIGGSPGKLGAISLAARACHRMGTGLVTIATWNAGFPILLARLADETMAVAIEPDLHAPSSTTYLNRIKDFSSVVIGPGMGTDPEARTLLEAVLLNTPGPLILDADALNLISDSGFHDLVLQRKKPTVLTPHPGEMARLLKRPKDSVMSDPMAAVEEAVALTGAVVVLKGAATFIGSPDEVISLNHFPNDGMATAGAGDVLAGMIGGLLGQGMPALEAAHLGVFLHSLAGAHAADRLGHRSMTSSDIVEAIGPAFRSLENPEVADDSAVGAVRIR